MPTLRSRLLPLALTVAFAASGATAAIPRLQTPAPATQAPATGAATAKPKRQAPKPLPEAAPGGGPDKVWVNLTTAKYHCFGDRYYGKTGNGRYMTEAAAKSAGAKGPRGKPCPAPK